MVQVFSGNDIYPYEQYVSVKLQQVQQNYRLLNHFGMLRKQPDPRSKLLKQGQ